MKKSYIGYAPKRENVVKLANYIQSSTPASKEIKKTEVPKKGKQKRF